MVLFRYFEDFLIDTKTGESNLTQIYIQVIQKEIFNYDSFNGINGGKYSKYGTLCCRM